MYSYQLVFESNEYVSFQMFVKALRDINDANGSSLKTIEKQIRQTYLVEVRRRNATQNRDSERVQHFERKSSLPAPAHL